MYYYIYIHARNQRGITSYDLDLRSGGHLKPTKSLKNRGGEWSFKKYGFRKIFVKFLGSQSLDFCVDCQRLRDSNFCKVVSDYRSQSHILKGKKVSGSQRKTPVSPSRKVMFLPFSTPKNKQLGNSKIYTCGESSSVVVQSFPWFKPV